MADHTQTITNTLGSIMGMGQPTLWNAFTWGTDNWGYDADMPTDVDVAPDMADLTLTVALGQDVVFEGTTNTMVLSDAYGKDFDKAPITESIVFTEDIESIMRAWGIWDNIFTKPTTDGQDKVFDEFDRVSDGSTTWTPVSDGSTSWEDV
jgi:hypothetical protein